MDELDDRKLFEYDEYMLVDDSEWQATQLFYTMEPPQAQEMDNITSVEFSRNGEHLAVGDHGGRIWIYSTNKGRNECKPPPFKANDNNSNNNNDNKVDSDDISGDSNDDINNYTNGVLLYDFYGQFQSHQAEFDYLKSLEIEERINCISWCVTSNNSLSLLACNGVFLRYIFLLYCAVVMYIIIWILFV